MTSPSSAPGLDFTDPALWGSRIPHEEFASLRRTAPVSWVEQPPISGYTDGGYWAVTKHADVKDVSRNPAVFSSALKTSIIRYPAGATEEEIGVSKAMLVNMDAPKHTAYRRIISRGFTPRAVDSLREALAARAQSIVAEARQAGAGDFVEQVACELPLQAIAELLGVPQSDRRKLFDWSNQVLNWDDPEYDVDPNQATAELIGYAWNLAEQRRAEPVDDIVTKLVTADVDGDGLASEEFSFFVILLSIAGNETTRNAITHGMKAFVDNPEQWELFKAQRPATTADEIVRWATPVTAFQRAATQDTELGGVTIRQGQRLGLFYSSANFDDEAFGDPFSFNVLRDPNPHVGFGGTGAHYCVGANLARLEIDLIFNAIADTMPNLTQLSEPERLRSPWINGIKHWQVRYT
ncbi:cytochrome P450 [Mycobacterium malmoense]|uniref:Steroid C27-monooxygenase n=1 Tax=Mycobacterium malmoense TaxID=1780 RepID=A0ABX3STB2_MYCMA|nr:cytochrome P450 [Mycobacterium malmoense]ORA83293.1 steroid C27-monooxygenase [Mycobacterium malmoense]QZA16075.1 cytochrome P450 [Mycobacterium malmoense]UNB92887.1 cytochrome P450 [Mycobacterium malmoense]